MFSADLPERPSAERKQTSLPTCGSKSSEALAESVHASKMHVRRTPPFLNLQFGCEINATVVWLRRKLCNDRSSDFPLFAQGAPRVHRVLSRLAQACFSSIRRRTD